MTYTLKYVSQKLYNKNSGVQRVKKTKEHAMEQQMGVNINEKDLVEIRHAFVKMYNSLATINYCSGGTVGMAQQKALEQMSSFIRAKTKQNHPMNEYLKKLDSENRKNMSEYIMKNSFSNNVFDDAVVAKRWKNMADSELKSSLVAFNNIYRKYPITQQSNTQVNINKQHLMQLFANMIERNKGK